MTRQNNGTKINIWSWQVWRICRMWKNFRYQLHEHWKNEDVCHTEKKLGADFLVWKKKTHFFTNVSFKRDSYSPKDCTVNGQTAHAKYYSRLIKETRIKNTRKAATKQILSFSRQCTYCKDVLKNIVIGSCAIYFLLANLKRKLKEFVLFFWLCFVFMLPKLHQPQQKCISQANIRMYSEKDSRTLKSDVLRLSKLRDKCVELIAYEVHDSWLFLFWLNQKIFCSYLKGKKQTKRDAWKG